MIKLGTSIINSSGSSIPNLIVNEAKETKTTRSVIHDIPSINNDIVQTMGNKNRRFNVTGWAIQTGSDDLPLKIARNDLQYLAGNTGSVSSDLLTQTQVLYTSVEIDDRSGRPLEFKFGLDVIEVI